MKRFTWIAVTILAFFALFTNSTVIAQDGNPNDVATVSIQPTTITWASNVNNIAGMSLTIAGPDDYYFQQDYAGNANPRISNSGLADGVYTYELVLWPYSQGSEEGSPNDSPTRGLDAQSQNDLKQSGAFTVRSGAFVVAVQEPAPRDVVHADDTIVQGSMCVGFDCVNNENFGFDTIRLKENNLRIKFEDTSVGAFPTNDWTIVANDSASGGASFLAFEDVTGGKFPFKVTAGAPTNSLFVSSNGDVGLNTSTPVLDLHINRSDTPSIRLEQTNAGGFSAQTWDVAGNEANFFIRDVTGGSKLSFRIRPGAPTSSIDIASNGNVGIGTGSPAYDLDISNTGANTILTVQRTSGAKVQLFAGAGQGFVGTETNHPLTFYTNNTDQMTLGTNGSLTVNGSVTATAFNPSSDRNIKENFVPVNQASVLDRLANIPISTWNFIANDNKSLHMGPMAQDFYAAFGLGMDDKHISTVDADGVAFAAIQELNKRNTDLTVRVSALEAGAPVGQPSQNWMLTVLVVMNLILLSLVAFAFRRGAFSRTESDNR